MSFKQYRSKAAAAHAKAQLLRDVPFARIRINDDHTLTVWVHRAALSPAQVALVEEHDARTPPPPDPSKPLLKPHKRGPTVSQSTVDNAAGVCREVFAKYHAAGRFHERKKALAEAVDRGVTYNTARTYYGRYRTDHGLPNLYRSRKAVDRRKSPATLSGRPLVGSRVCNGVTEPAIGSLRREVWDMADVLRRKFGRTPKRGEVAARLTSPGKDTIRKSYQAWRKFHNLPPAGRYNPKKG